MKNISKEQEKKKYKRIYCGEFLLFGLAFAVIGILDIIGVISPSEKRHNIFNWVTVFGSVFLMFTIFWTIFSKKKREKTSLMDKILLLPVALYIFAYDIMCFAGVIGGAYGIFQGAALFYIGCIYVFEAFYHYYIPNPELQKIFDEIDHPSDEKAEKVVEVKEESINNEDTKPEEHE